jgi:carotenoid cleavage dioxygenase-like enzyme
VRGSPARGKRGISWRDLLRRGAGVAATAAALNVAPSLAVAARPRRGDWRVGFTTLRREVALDRLPVEGRLPDWLRGTLVRNGPAQFEVGDERLDHWFDGLAMLHAFAFERGHVRYANRFLRSSQYHAAREEGRIRYRSSPPIPAG